MELVDRYVAEIGRQLPARKREDVKAELRSLLEDTLEGRCEGAPTEADVIAVLKEFGAPGKVAAQYRPGPQYLIGPELMPLFMMVAKIVVAALGVSAVVVYAIGIWFGRTAADPAQALVDALLMLAQAAMSALGSLVLVFAILDRLHVRPDLAGDWDPRTLPPVDAPVETSRVEAAVGIGIIAVFGVLLNLFSDRIGVVMSPGEPVLLNNVLVSNLPWINVSLLLGIALNAILLVQGRWHWYTQVGRLATDLFGVYVYYRVALGIEAESAVLAEAGFPASGLPITILVLKGLTWVFLGLTLLEAGKGFYRLLRRSPEPFATIREKAA
jgi:hypothetical protein